MSKLFHLDPFGIPQKFSLHNDKSYATKVREKPNFREKCFGNHYRPTVLLALNFNKWLRSQSLLQKDVYKATLYLIW